MNIATNLSKYFVRVTCGDMTTHFTSHATPCSQNYVNLIILFVSSFYFLRKTYFMKSYMQEKRLITKVDSSFNIFTSIWLYLFQQFFPRGQFKKSDKVSNSHFLCLMNIIRLQGTKWKKARKSYVWSALRVKFHFGMYIL